MSRKNQKKTKVTEEEEDEGPSLFDDEDDDVVETKIKINKKRKTAPPVVPVKDEEETDDEAPPLSPVASEQKAVVSRLPVQILPPPPGYDFNVKITNSASFRTMIEIASHVLEDVVFVVNSSEQFSGLSLSCEDANVVCMIIGRYACETASLPNQHFCVKISILKNLLKFMTPRHCLEISRELNGDTILMLVHDPHNSSNYRKFEVPTIDREPEQTMLDKFASDFTVEMDLDGFRSLVKLAKDLQAEDLTFQIFEEKERGAMRSSYLVLSVAGNAKCSEVFHSLTEWELQSDGQVIIKTAEEPLSSKHRQLPAKDKLVERLNEKFSINYLHNFLTSMKHPTLTFRLSVNGQPMVLNHQLGSESQLSFVLAPKLKDESSQ